MSIKTQEFHAAMFAVYVQAKEQYGYNATGFLGMLDRNDAVDVAHSLLQRSEPGDGFIALYERGGLDVTVEALVLKPEWRDSGLFTEFELDRARKRLTDCGFDVEAWEVEHGG